MENVLQGLSVHRRIVGWGGSPKIFHCPKALAVTSWRWWSPPYPWVFYPEQEKETEEEEGRKERGGGRGRKRGEREYRRA